MSKKHFIKLADCLRAHKSEIFASEFQWEQTLEAIGNFCASQNPRFNRERWLDYIAGECGPNGGKVAR